MTTIRPIIEKQVLGHLIAFGKSGETDSVFEILAKLEPEHFESEKHRILYSEIVETFVKRKKLDTLTLFTELTRKKKLEMAGGGDYINELYAKREYSSDVFATVDQLVSLHKHDSLLKYCKDAVLRLEGGELGEKVANDLDKQIYALRERQNDTIVNIPKEAKTIIEKANNAEQYGCYGFSWGIPRLNYLTGGIETGKTYVIGATKKSGKSKMVINTIYNLKSQKVKSLFLSLEMGGESVVKELLSRFALIDNNAMKKKLDPDVQAKLEHTINDIADGIIVDTQPFLNLMQIRHKVRMASQEGVKVVFLDYLQRIDFQLKGSSLNFATVIAQAVTQLADIAKEFNVALIFLSQLNNQAENRDATIADLKDSGGIGEGVDCILILNNQDRIQKNYSGKTNEIFITIDQRSGASGIVKCMVDLSIARYLPIAEEDHERTF